MNLRNLELFKTKNSRYTPTNSRKVSVKITFVKNFEILDQIFKDNKNLIEVDLTNLNMSNIFNMDRTFIGCPNLKNTDIEGVNGPKLSQMENTFENCFELNSINLLPLSNKNLVNIKNFFLDVKIYKL